MWDMSVSATGYNSQSVICTQKKKKEKSPKCHTIDYGKSSTQHEGLQCAHIVITFNVACPVVTFKREATMWH